MQSQQFPAAVIVASNPVCTSMANGIMMRSLFEGWPQTRLAQLYFHILARRYPDLDMCREFRAICMSGRVTTTAGNTKLDSIDDLPQTPNGKSDWRRQFIQWLTHRKRGIQWAKLGQELWCGHSHLQRVLQRQLETLRPDVVYALIGQYGVNRIVYHACRNLKIPLYVHVTDDYVTNLYSEMPFGRHIQEASENCFRETVNYASGLAAISPAMAQEFQHRYGGTWNWFTTLVDGSAYDPSPSTRTGTTRLLFSGNLGLNRWQVLRDLAAALASIQSHNDQKFELNIYAAPEQWHPLRKKVEVPGITYFRGWVPHQRLPDLYHQADVLVHVESDNASTMRYTRFSLSTKISQYMMSGRCILGIGPNHLASMQIIQQAESGVTLDDVLQAANTRRLRQLVEQASLRTECALNGRKWAQQWADATKRRGEFRGEMATAAASAHNHSLRAA